MNCRGITARPGTLAAAVLLDDSAIDRLVVAVVL
jgi:hypothetical protein